MSATVQWYWLTYSNGWGHMVTGDLLDAVRADMERQDPPGEFRRCEVLALEECTLYIDQGGMMHMSRPNEIVEFLGLKITVPSEDLGDMILRWTDAPAVESLGKVFRRFSSNGRCLVVGEDRRGELLDLLCSRVESAEDRAAAFYGIQDTPQEALRRINEARGATIEYGPDKLVRFRTS